MKLKFAVDTTLANMADALRLIPASALRRSISVTAQPALLPVHVADGAD